MGDPDYVGVIVATFVFYGFSVWGLEPNGGSPRWVRPISAVLSGAIVLAVIGYGGWLVALAIGRH